MAQINGNNRKNNETGSVGRNYIVVKGASASHSSAFQICKMTQVFTI